MSRSRRTIGMSLAEYIIAGLPLVALIAGLMWAHRA
jgi:hypothetical protein